MTAGRRNGVWREVAARAAALVVAAAVCVAPGPALSQPADEPPYLDARERAERDWDAMTQSASAFWDETGEVLAQISDNPVAAALALGAAAAVGGFLGARARGRAPGDPGGPSSKDAPRSRPARRRPASQEAREAGDGMIFRAEGEGVARSRPAEPTAGGADAAEAARLFRFFEDRFGLAERSADAAIDFFSRLARSIDGLRQRAEAAEQQRERLAAEGRGGGAPTAEADSADAAAWRLISDGMRLARATLQNSRAADPELDRFEKAVELEETLIGLAALRAEQSQPAEERGGRRGLDPRVIEEAWPHALFRAEALLQTYYPGAGPWGDLREAVGLIGASLRRLLRAAGVSVSAITLLSPFEPELGERWSDAAEELTDLEQVRTRLREAAAREAGPLVIDCETFGYRDLSRGIASKSRLILMDPEEWR